MAGFGNSMLEATCIGMFDSETVREDWPVRRIHGEWRASTRAVSADFVIPSSGACAAHSLFQAPRSGQRIRRCNSTSDCPRALCAHEIRAKMSKRRLEDGSIAKNTQLHNMC
ncbi:hypothetical protein [Burkholderia mayonis]|uniref:hypothetical protein n=1 Tax=Burkholderia mayonis TaxID=1385591 RepID=UPI00131F2824|nr:hypothetical protein [Burkholderia mayonis]